MGESILFLGISSVCALFFIGIGIFAINKKTPMHFWAGSTVKAERISDIKAYNRANGIMWIAYGSIFILAGIVALLSSSDIAAALMAICSTVGIIVLVIFYQFIYRKYKIKD